ncbi:MAG: hypothetical protein LBK44_07430 [Spirochaetales bacterium]|nr:hypothetical protein [Spirochaetales bacterium]
MRFLWAFRYYPLRSDSSKSGPQPGGRNLPQQNAWVATKRGAKRSARLYHRRLPPQGFSRY